MFSGFIYILWKKASKLRDKKAGKIFKQIYSFRSLLFSSFFPMPFVPLLYGLQKTRKHGLDFFLSVVRNLRNSRFVPQVCKKRKKNMAAASSSTPFLEIRQENNQSHQITQHQSSADAAPPVVVPQKKRRNQPGTSCK